MAVAEDFDGPAADGGEATQASASGKACKRIGREQRVYSLEAALAWAAELTSDLLSPPTKMTVCDLAATWLVERVRVPRSPKPATPAVTRAWGSGGLT